MSRAQINGRKRTLKAKMTRLLRRQGFTPIAVYGPNVDPFSAEVVTKDLNTLLAKVESELIELNIEGETNPHVVLVQDIQEDPITNLPLHVDFLEVDLTQPVEVDVALEFLGEVKAVEEKRGILLFQLEEVPVRVLPTQIPQHIAVDLSLVQEVGDQFTVGQLVLPEGVHLLLDDPDELIVKVEPVRTAAEEEEAAAASAADRAEADAAAGITEDAAGEDAADKDDKDED